MNTPGSQAGTNEIGILDDFKRDGSDSMPDDGHGGDIDEDARANGSQEDCSDEEDYEDKGNIQQTSAVLPGVASQVKKVIDFGAVMAIPASFAGTITKLPHSEREKFAGALLTLTTIAAKRNCAYFSPDGRSTPQTLEQVLYEHLSCFSTNHVNPFASSGDDEQGPSLQHNDEQVGRLASKRKPSKCERLLNSQPKTPQCTFCKKPGHSQDRTALRISLYAASQPHPSKYCQGRVVEKGCRFYISLGRETINIIIERNNWRCRQYMVTALARGYLSHCYQTMLLFS